MGAQCEFTLPSPVREATTAPLTVSGPPGEQAYLYLSRSSRFQYLPVWKGVWLTAPPYVRRLQLGTIPPSGLLSTRLAFPDMGPGFSASTWFVQALRVDAVGNVTLGSLASVTILDSSY